MSAKESSFISMLVTLVLVTGVAALSLGFVFKFTEEPIAKAKAEKQLRAIRAVVGDYDNDPLVESFTVCREAGGFSKCEEASGEDALKFYPATIQSERSATGILTYSDKGYSGRIEIMVGLDKQGVIKNIEVVSHAETPGLGSKMSDPKFKDQFIGQRLGDPIQVTKDGGAVDAISGATISSRAFSEAVQLALEAHEEIKSGL